MQRGPAPCSFLAPCTVWHLLALVTLPLHLQSQSRHASMGSMILGQYLVATSNCSQSALHPVWHTVLLLGPSGNSSVLENCLQAAGAGDYPLLLLSNTSSGTGARPPPASCWGFKDTWSGGSTAGGGGP